MNLHFNRSSGNFVPILRALFPFLRWFPMSANSLRADFLSGITVALVLVPQSMAYAQLAGLPVFYGLYAAFIPVIVASLWGSSSQLHTGPVAMLSLMSAAALIPFASPGTDYFIELSVMLALMVGVLRLALGVFRLGSVVNLLSSPVIVGFTNAAALIIGLSQLSKVIGVPFPRTDSYLADLWRVIAQLPEIHYQTLLFAVATWVTISWLRKHWPVLPGVLIVVVLATIVSAVTHYENKISLGWDQLADQQVATEIHAFRAMQERAAALTTDIAEKNRRAEKLEKEGGYERIQEAAEIRAKVAVLEHELGLLNKEITQARVSLHAIRFEGGTDSSERFMLYRTGLVPSGYESDHRRWRFSSVNEGGISFSSGGAVVGEIPKGLPGFSVPGIESGLILSLLPAALVMALIGFMEASSISKAISATTGERVDTSKELIGQGLANIAGSFFSSYTVSGSFSRSAVAAKSGAQTGLFAIISAVGVVLVLLYFTEYLYHLPQAVLAVIVMMAVFSLIRIRPLVQAWKIDTVGAVIGIITFLSTLLMAPSIANGILLGVALTVLYYLIRTMRPRVEIISRKPDGTLGGIRAHDLKPMSQDFVPVRFDGSLTFINVAYFEDMILDAHREFPEARVILIVGSGINEIDASGEEKIREVADRLRRTGVQLVFSGLKHQVKSILERSGIVDELGKDAFFKNKEAALEELFYRFGHGASNESIVELPRVTRLMTNNRPRRLL